MGARLNKPLQFIISFNVLEVNFLIGTYLNILMKKLKGFKEFSRPIGKQLEKCAVIEIINF